MKKIKKKVNDIVRGDIANCIMLHDFAIEKPNFKQWVEYVTEFFQQHDLVPNRLGGHKMDAAKNVTFAGGIRALEKNNYDTDSIWIGALPPDHHSDMFCAIFDSSIATAKQNNRYCCNVIFDNNIIKFKESLIDKLVVDLINITGAKYGYGFQRNFRCIVGYERGVISGLEDDNPECELITKWQDAHGMCSPNGNYQTGYFRDIYRVNIISIQHLENQVEGVGLEDWIKSDPKRGELVQIMPDRWSWHVAEENISMVRESLRHTGFILCI